jgi:hypothetical protein
VLEPSEVLVCSVLTVSIEPSASPDSGIVAVSVSTSVRLFVVVNLPGTG